MHFLALFPPLTFLTVHIGPTYTQNLTGIPKITDGDTIRIGKTASRPSITVAVPNQIEDGPNNVCEC